eukprot:634878-Rhodomonas_salina.2
MSRSLALKAQCQCFGSGPGASDSGFATWPGPLRRHSGHGPSRTARRVSLGLRRRVGDRSGSGRAGLARVNVWHHDHHDHDHASDSDSDSGWQRQGFKCNLASSTGSGKSSLTRPQAEVY